MAQFFSTTPMVSVFAIYIAPILLDSRGFLRSLAMGSDPDVIFAGGTFSRISKWSVPRRQGCWSVASYFVKRHGLPIPSMYGVFTIQFG